jgi:hypothetical protein
VFTGVGSGLDDGLLCTHRCAICGRIAGGESGRNGGTGKREAGGDGKTLDLDTHVQVLMDIASGRRRGENAALAAVVVDRQAHRPCTTWQRERCTR